MPLIKKITKLISPESEIFNKHNETLQFLIYAGLISIVGIISILVVYGFDLIGLLLVIALALGLLASCISPLITFSIYFAILFVHNLNIPGTTTSINTLVAPTFFLTTFLWAVLGKTQNIRSGILGLLSVIAAYFFFSALTGIDPEAGMLHARYVIIYFVWALCIALILNKESTITKLVTIVYSLAIISSCIGIFEGVSKNMIANFAGHWGQGLRVQGLAPNPVVYAWQLTFSIPFGFYLYAQSKTNFGKFFMLGTFFLLVVAACLTFNRQTYLFIVMLTGLCGLLFHYKYKKIVLTALGIFGVLISIPILPLIIKRLLSVANLSRDYSYLERRDSFLIGMEMYNDKPLFGIGLGSFHTKWRDYLPPDYTTFFSQYRLGNQPRYPDFTYLQLISETGLVGLFLFFVLHVSLIIIAVKFRKQALQAGDSLAANYATLILCLLIFLVTSAFIQDIFLTPRAWMVYGMALLLTPRIFGIRKTDEPL